jgi:hypothetical protein
VRQPTLAKFLQAFRQVCPYGKSWICCELVSCRKNTTVSVKILFNKITQGNFPFFAPLYIEGQKIAADCLLLICHSAV